MSRELTFDTFRSAETSAVFFDVRDRTQLEITGEDRVRFLQGFTSNDIKGLKSGRGCETFLTNLKGKVVAHVYAFCTETSIWLDGFPTQSAAITGHLSKYVLIDDVQIIDRSQERGELFVSGPLAAQLLQLDDGLQILGHLRRDSDGGAIEIRRIDMFSQPGFLLSAAPSRIETIKQGFQLVGIVEGSKELFEYLRISSGYPQFGIDTTDDNLAQEVGRTKQCVSFTKGCYLGQETVARLDALGHTNRELRCVRFEADTVPAAQATIFDESGTTEVGSITSATIDLEAAINNQPAAVVSIACLKRIALNPGSVVCLKSGDKLVSGRVQ